MSALPLPRRAGRVARLSSGRGRAAVAALSLVLAIVVVVLAISTATGPFAPWAGFSGVVGIAILVAGLAQCSPRAIGGAAGVLGVACACGGLGRLSGAGGALEIAVVAACLFLAAELGIWSGELRTPVFSERPDFRRPAFALAVALGGAALGGVAVLVATGAARSAGGLVAVVGAAVACCLVGVLAVLLLAGSGGAPRPGPG